MEKVAVFGNAGGGKSTLRKQLAELIGLPWVPYKPQVLKPVMIVNLDRAVGIAFATREEEGCFDRWSDDTIRMLFGSSGGQPLEVTGKEQCESAAVPQL